MDENAYRELYREVNDRQCHYEKAILSTRCSCSTMRKINLAEREAARCEEEAAWRRCHHYLETLRQAAIFTLKARGEGQRLPHAKAMRLQMGGLRGLYAALHPGQSVPDPIPDISGLLAEAQKRWGSFEALPFEEIIKEVAAWEGRRPKRRRR